jgi:hypothetical protein
VLLIALWAIGKVLSVVLLVVEFGCRVCTLSLNTCTSAHFASCQAWTWSCGVLFKGIVGRHSLLQLFVGPLSAGRLLLREWPGTYELRGSALFYSKLDPASSFGSYHCWL